LDVGVDVVEVGNPLTEPTALFADPAVITVLEGSEDAL
jgi:hypothetical protein